MRDDDAADDGRLAVARLGEGCEEAAERAALRRGPLGRALRDLAGDDALVRLVEVRVGRQDEEVLALDRADDLVVLEHLVLGRALHERDALLGVDGEEETAGALDDGGVLLEGRAQLLAHVVQLVEVGAGAEPALDLAVGVAVRLGAAEVPPPLAVVPPTPVLDRVGLARRERVAPRLERGGHVVCGRARGRQVDVSERSLRAAGGGRGGRTLVERRLPAEAEARLGLRAGVGVLQGEARRQSPSSSKSEAKERRERRDAPSSR